MVWISRLSKLQRPPGPGTETSPLPLYQEGELAAEAAGCSGFLKCSGGGRGYSENRLGGSIRRTGPAGGGTGVPVFMY